MKTANLVTGLLSALLLLSCGGSARDGSGPRLDLDGANGIDAYVAGVEAPVLRGLGASCTDGDGRVVSFPLADARVEETPFSDDMGSGSETTLVAVEGGLRLGWTLRLFDDGARLAARLGVANNGDEERRIGRLTPLATAGAGGGLAVGTEGELHYLDITPRTWAPKAVRRLEGAGTGRFVTGVADAAGRGVVIGALSVERFKGVFDLEDRRDAAGTVGLSLYNDVDEGLVVEPGETLTSEWIAVHPVEDIFAGLEEWAALVGRLNGAVFAEPDATGFYTWYYYREHVSEEIMMANARFLAKNRDRFPVNYVHLDWGWQRRFSTGDTHVNEKFPHGLEWLARQIEELGFHPSIWVNPFMYTVPSAEAPVEHPDLFLRNTSGDLVEREPIRNIMGREFGNGEHMILDGVTNILDVSAPGTEVFLRDRYAWVAGLGYDMAMMDFVQSAEPDAEKGDVLRNSQVSVVEGTRRALLAAREGLGPDVGVLGCGTVYESSVGTSNLTRISTDAPAIWHSVETASLDLILQYFMNDRLWTNYADGLFVRDRISPYWREDWWDENEDLVPMRLSDSEAEVYAAVTGLSQAAVMVTEDIPRLAPHRQWLLTMVLPIYHGGRFRPVDLFTTTAPGTLRLDCREGDRAWTVAARVNWEDEDAPGGLDLGLLGLDGGRGYHVFDVFGRRYVGTLSSSDSVGPVRAHGVLVVNLVENVGHPQLVGTDLHISQGGLEVATEAWDEASGELTIMLNDLHGRQGHLYVHVPTPYRYTGEGAETSNLDEGSLLEVPVTLEGKGRVTLAFGHGQ